MKTCWFLVHGFGPATWHPYTAGHIRCWNAGYLYVGCTAQCIPSGIPIAPASECVRNKKSLANFDFFCVSQKLGYSRYSRYSSIAIIYGHLNIENNDWLRVPHLAQNPSVGLSSTCTESENLNQMIPSEYHLVFFTINPCPNIKYSPKNPKSYGLAIDLFMFGAPQIAGIS